MDMLGLGFIAGLSFWPMFVFILWMVALLSLVEYEWSGFAAVFVLVGLGGLYFIGGYDVVGYILNNPLTIVMWTAVYIGVGVAYSFFRWDRYSRKWREEYDKLNPGSYQQTAAWEHKPAASTSKNRLTTWMMFWPWSGFWWVCSDFIVSVFEWFYRKLAGVYERIARRHIEGAAPPPSARL